jgi:VCBS repeat-containing protein
MKKLISRRRARGSSLVAFAGLICAVLLVGPLAAALQRPSSPDDCTIRGTAGPDVLTGTAGSDTICGFGGNDVLRGGNGSDRLHGGDGRDELLGGSGNDQLRGDAGTDHLSGGAGNDNLRGGDGPDVFVGGAGSDLADYLAYDDPVTLSIGDGAADGKANEHDNIRSGVENLRGGSGNDSLRGTSGPNWLHGYEGGDNVRGGAGDDRLYGGEGGDTLSARDSAAFTDGVYCGNGDSDAASADTRDRVGADCENVNQNRAPTDILLSTASVGENEPAATTVGTLSASDPDTGDTHTYGLAGGLGDTDNGSFNVAGSALRTNAAFDYERKRSYSLRVRVTDGEGATFEKALTVAITDKLENLSPVAVDDTVTATEDTRLQLPLSGLGSPAANDTDADSNPLTVSAVSAARGGSVSISGGQISFDPTANLCGGGAGFDYTVSDGQGGTDVGRVAVAITCTPDDPAAADDSATLAEDAAATTIDVLANDNDPDGEPVVIDSVTPAADGTVVITNGGADLTYEPNGDFCGPDSFTYTLLGGPTATVDVTVSCVNDAPVVSGATVSLPENSANGTAVHTVAFTDVESTQSHTFAITAGNTNGAFAIDATGAITVANSAALDFETTPRFDLTVQVTDDGTPPESGTATITVDLTDTGEPPVVDPATFTTPEDGSAGASVGTVTFTDPDAGQNHTFAITAGNTGNAFAIDSGSGEITVAQPLDFETTDSYSLTVQVTDDGTPSLSGTATITVNVTNVNEAPSITAPATVSVNRDVARVVTGISVADPDAGDIELTLAAGNGTIDVDETASAAVVTGDGTATVVVTGTVTEINAMLGAAAGVTYLNNPGFTGVTDSLQLDVDDLGTPALTASATVTIQFNQPPVALDVTASTDEDDFVVVNLSGTDADGDSLTFSIVNGPTNGTLGTIGSVDCATTPNTCTAQVTYTPNLNFNGSDQFTYRVDDGEDTDTGTVDITVNALNDAPSIALSGSTPSFTEGGPAATVDDGIVVADVDDTSLVSGSVSISTGLVAGDALSFTVAGGIIDTNPAPEVLALTGTATVADWQSVLRSVQFSSTSDNPTDAARTISFVVNDGDTDSNTVQKSVAVVPVNDAPLVATSSGATAFAEDGGPVTVDSGVTVTDADNSTLASATVTISNLQDTGAEVLAASPSGAIVAGDINYTAPTLTIAHAGGASPADFQAVLRSVTYNNTSNAPDLSARSLVFEVNDGSAVGATSSKTVTVSETNDAPVAGDDTLTDVLEDSTTRVIPFADLLANDTTGGEPGQTLTITNASGPTGGTAVINGTNVEFTPAANFFGAAGFTYSVTDNGATGGAADPKSDTAAVSFQVLAVNDQPSFTLDSGPAAVDEDAGAQTVAGFANDMSAGPANESGQALNFDASNNNNALFTAGGQPAIDAANGNLTYTPAANQNGSATVSVNLHDNGGTDNGGVDTSATRQFTITVNPVNDKPVATAKTFAVQANMQRTLTGLLDGASDPDAGDAGYTPSFSLASVTAGGGSCTGCTISNVNANGSVDIDPPAGQTGTFTLEYTITDSGNPGPAATSDPQTITLNISGPVIWFVRATGGNDTTGRGTLAAPFQTLAKVDSVDAANQSIFLYSGSYANGITLNTNEDLVGQGASGSASFDLLFGITPPNGTIARPPINSGTATVQNTVTLASQALLRGLALSTGTATALTGSGGLSGIDVSQTSVATTTGTAVNLNNAVGSYSFSSISTNGAANGILFDTMGASTFTAGGSIVGATSRGIDINAGSGNFTYNGTITSTGSGRSVEITNRTGGTAAFNGAITDNGTGINLQSNGGATVNFTGGVTASTGTSGAFSATGGGTVSVTGAANTLATTSGTALNVANTTIGANGLTFRSVASNGAASGIVLNATGANGGLTVTGNAGSCTSAATCTGGAIQSSSGPGIALTNVGGGVNLTRMSVNNGGDDGIRGTTVSGLSLANSVVLANGNAVGERGIDMFDLTGSGGLASSTVSGSSETNVRIENNTATALTAFNVTGSTISSTSLVTGDDGILVLNDGAGAMNVSVTGSTFTDNKGDHFQAASDADASGSINVTFDNNTLNTTLNGAPGDSPVIIGGGITINTSGTLDINFHVGNNTIQRAFDDAINLNLDPGSQAGATFVGTITGNTIGTAGALDSGSESSNTITFAAKGAGTATVAITDNNVRQFSNAFGIVVSANEGSPVVNATVTGNTVKEPGTFALNGIRVDAGATAGPPPDSSTLCANVTGNDATGSAKAPPSDTDIRLRQRFSTTIRLPGYTGGNSDTTAVNAFVAANNDPTGPTLAPSVSSVFNTPTGGGYVGGAACATP